MPARRPKQANPLCESAFAFVPAVRPAAIALLLRGSARAGGRTARRRPSSPALAEKLGIGGLLIKDETARFGLNAFKTAGATLRRGRTPRTGRHPRAATRWSARAKATTDAPSPARRATSAARRASTWRTASLAPVWRRFEREGAEIVPVHGSYDEAVRDDGGGCGRARMDGDFGYGDGTATMRFLGSSCSATRG